MPPTPKEERAQRGKPALGDATVALVTGGGSGIGRAIAHTLADAGAKVVLSGRRQDVVATVAKEIEAAGGQALAVAGDVAKPEDCRRMVAATVAAFGSLGLLVNNAGIARAGAIEQCSEEDVHALIDIDLKGPIWMIQAALGELRRQGEAGGSSIINISSSVTCQPVPNFSVYSAAKAGLDMLTRCLARDLASDRIRVNAIRPGVVATPILATMMPEKTVDRALSSFAQQTPLGRVGQPEDVARLALYLASPNAAWMTGSVLTLDGGISLAS